MKAYIAILLTALIGWMPKVYAAGFTSIHAFGDSLSATTDTPSPSDDYYGGRYCNGRIWIEVLAGWQGIAYVPAQNISTFGYDIEDVELDLTTYTAPVDAATALYILWVSGADFANFMFAVGSAQPYEASNIAAWNTFITNTLDSHEAAIIALYDEGVRKLVLPNQPDLSVAPIFGLSASELSFIKARVQQFNAGLEARLAALLSTRSDLEVWTPDVFNLFEDMLANPSAYSLQTPATFAPPILDYALLGASVPPDFEDGFGTDYVFWDDLNPTAAVQFILADLIQSEVCPPKIDSITQVTGGFDLQFSNLQVGRLGSIEGSEFLDSWVEDLAITPTSTSETKTLNPAATQRFFRLNFESGWIWP